MKYLFLLLIISFQSAATNLHYVYLTTHAEAQHKTVNPGLSSCGRLRASQLATLLGYASITRIYSTTDLSVMETANPLAKANQLPVKIFTKKLTDSLAITAMNESENALIVADKETIEFLLEFITEQKVSISEKDKHNILYQIAFIDDLKLINILKQPLVC